MHTEASNPIRIYVALEFTEYKLLRPKQQSVQKFQKKKLTIENYQKKKIRLGKFTIYWTFSYSKKLLKLEKKPRLKKYANKTKPDKKNVRLKKNGKWTDRN